MASTRIRVTNHLGRSLSVRMKWLPFTVSEQWVPDGQTVDFPCEWVWYDFVGDPDNGYGGISLKSGVYGGSDIVLGT